MNVSDIASMFAALGSCAAALATWRTVTEMKRQREASWRPDIACIFPVLTTGEDAPCLRLRNVGFGVAKDVRVELSMPLERLIPVVNEALRDEGISLAREDGQIKIFHSEENGFSSRGHDIPQRNFIIRFK